MGNALIEKLQADRQSQFDFCDQLQAKAIEEGRELVETERRSIDTATEVITGIDAQLTPLIAFENARNSAAVIDSALQQRATAAGSAGGQRSGRGGSRELGDAAFRSFGELYTESEAFQTRGYMATLVDDSTDVTKLALQTRAILTTGSSPGSGFLPKPDRYQVPMPDVQTPLLDLITKVPVNTGSVDVLTWGVITGSDEVAEGTAKPEVTIPTGTTPLPLKTVAGWAKYTRQLAEDAPDFADFLTRGITRDLLRKLQAIVAAAIAAASLPTTTGTSGKPMIEVLRQGIATVESAGFTPNVLIASPANIAALDIAVLNLGGSAATVMGRGQWNLTPVPVPGFAKVVVADATDAFTLFTRSGIRMYTTDSDISGAGSTAASDFRTNVLTTLGETRANAAVTQPSAATQVVTTA